MSAKTLERRRGALLELKSDRADFSCKRSIVAIPLRSFSGAIANGSAQIFL